MEYKKWVPICLCLAILTSLNARIFYVSPKGNDANRGSLEKPLRTISSGARRARPGDIVFVLEGTYRERITPVRGGEKGKPTTYQAEPGKRVFIKGSEILEGRLEKGKERNLFLWPPLISRSNYLPKSGAFFGRNTK